MKLALILTTLALALAAPLAHAKTPTPPAPAAAFYDLSKVLADSDEAKRNATDEKADADAKQAEVIAAEEAAKKAKPADRQGAENRAASLFQRDQQAIDQRRQDDNAKLLARVGRIVPVVAKAKHLDALVPLSVAFYASAPSDLTEEIMRRLNLGEGKDDEQLRAENEKLKLENARLVADKLAVTKPSPPPIPPPPPIQPLASKGGGR
jgi:Skp family chaperone for outer membrane proteins